MASIRIIFIISFSIIFFSCNKIENGKEKSVNIENLQSYVNFEETTSDFNTWWKYHTNEINLSSNFTGLNTKSDTIHKKQFLEKLITGQYIPLEIKSKKNTITYKLFKIDSSVDKRIRRTIKNVSLTNLKHYKMEGFKFPEFDLTDLKGDKFTNETTKNKILILKTWYIRCSACVAEFPELNEFVKKHEQEKNIIFLSLATDPEPELINFLLKKDFEYKVVANQRDFIQNKLNLKAYPTHIIVDKNGVILKVINKASEMIAFFENKRKKAEKNQLLPPPPPPPAH